MLRDITRPQFSTWLDPALYLVRGIGLSSPPSIPRLGDVYVNNSNQYLKYDGTAFIVVGAVQEDDRVINLDSTSINVFEYNGTTWEDQGTEDDNSVIMIEDDGTGTTRQYYYDANSDSWKTTCCPKSIDGGFACSVYLPEQRIDGGGACYQ